MLGVGCGGNQFYLEAFCRPRRPIARRPPSSERLARGSDAVRVRFEDIQDAIESVTSAPGGENTALLNKVTGHVYWHSVAADIEEIPQEIQDFADVVAIPHGNDLDLGRALVFRFVELKIPAAHDHGRAMFSRPGAYARYKDLLASKNLLEEWYDFCEKARDRALREWCEENGIGARLRFPALKSIPGAGVWRQGPSRDPLQARLRRRPRGLLPRSACKSRREPWRNSWTRICN